MPRDHPCDYFDAGRCRSCTLLGWPYERAARREAAPRRGAARRAPASPGCRRPRSAQLGLPQQGQDGRHRHRRGAGARHPRPDRRRRRPARLPAAHARASRRRSRCSRTSSPAPRLTPYDVRRAPRRAEVPAGHRVARRRADGAVRAPLAGAGRPDPQAPALAARGAAAAGGRVGEPPARAQGGPRGRAGDPADRAGDAADAGQRHRPAPAAAELLPDQHRDGRRALPARPGPGWPRSAPAACGTSTAGWAGSRCTWPAPGRDVLGVEISAEAIASAAHEPRRGRARRGAVRGGRRDGVRPRAGGRRPTWWS